MPSKRMLPLPWMPPRVLGQKCLPTSAPLTRRLPRKPSIATRNLSRQLPRTSPIIAPWHNAAGNPATNPMKALYALLIVGALSLAIMSIYTVVDGQRQQATYHDCLDRHATQDTWSSRVMCDQEGNVP